MPIEKSKWTYIAIEHIFDHVKAITKNKSQGYSIYGHSAGAQFVHRLVLFCPDARLNTAISANSGWYTMPINTFKFPYGLKESGISDEGLKQAFNQNMIILLGGKDTDEDHKHLRKTPEAMAQGKHRLFRGKNFYNTAKRESAKLNIPLKWKVKTVKDVGHSNSKMAKAAVKFLTKTGSVSRSRSVSKNVSKIGRDNANSSYLLKTNWGQRDEYAVFTPQNKRLGCWSTALAQILYYHKLTPAGVVDYKCKKSYHIKENLDSYTFDWKLFTNKLGERTSLRRQNEVAKYIYFASVAIQKDFGTGNYVLSHNQRAEAIARHYGCETKFYNNKKYSSDQIKQIIIEEIDASRPIMIHLKDIAAKNYHVVAVDGYRSLNNKFYIHANIGHKGKDNGWYDFAKPILKYNNNNYRKVMTIKPTQQFILRP